MEAELYGIRYEPVDRPCEDNWEMWVRRRLVLLEGTKNHPATRIHVVEQGKFSSGWVLGFVNDESVPTGEVRLKLASETPPEPGIKAVPLYQVIGVHRDTGELFSLEVAARNSTQAFLGVAGREGMGDGSLIVAVAASWRDVGFHYPGSRWVKCSEYLEAAAPNDPSKRIEPVVGKPNPMIESGDARVLSAILNHAAMIGNSGRGFAAMPKDTAQWAVEHTDALMEKLGQPVVDLKARVEALEQSLREILPLAGLKDGTEDEWRAFEGSVARANALLGGAK